MHGINQFHETVITGMGVVSSLGADAAVAAAAARDGQPGLGPLQQFSVDGLLAAEAPPFDLRSRLKNPKSEKLMSRSSRLAMFAASDAVLGSALDFDSMDRERVGLQVGSGNTGIDYDEFLPAFQLAWGEDSGADFGKLGGRASKLVDAYFSLRSLSNAGVGLLAAEHDLRGASNNFVQNSGASAWALATGAFDLQENRADAVLAGGYDSLIVKSVVLAYAEQNLLASGGAMHPFGAHRSGVALGEGAGFFLLENRPQAQARGAAELAAIEAFASRGMVRGDEDLQDALPALEPLLEEAFADGLRPDYVIANGISLPDQDRVEAQMLARLGVAPNRISAWKGWTGFVGGSTMAVELALTIASVSQGFLPSPLAGGDQDSALALGELSRQPIPVSERNPLVLLLASSWSGQACALWCRPCNPNGELVS